MATTLPDLKDNSFTELADRLLWADGDSSFDPDELCNRVLSGLCVDNMYVTKISQDIKIYNKLNPSSSIGIKTTLNEISNEWVIPQAYNDIDIPAYIFDILTTSLEDDDEDFILKRIHRVKLELKLYEQYGMMDLLRTIIYIVDTFRKHNVVWGTGRGSSCCSYILYLIGLHDVDSVTYELDLSEFFR